MYIGIDVGGTNLAAALVDEKFNIVRKSKARVDETMTGEALAKVLSDLALEAADDDREWVEYVGLGIPGEIDRAEGKVIYTPNAPFGGASLRRDFQKNWNIPVYLENDANCAALGEFYAGAAKGYRDAIVLTLGTGVGGGIISGGKLLLGTRGTAAEVGHMVIKMGGRPCACGRQGCWEAYASARGLKQTATEEMRSSRNSLMWQLCHGDIDRVSGKTPFQAMRRGDRAGKKVVEAYIQQLSAGVINLVNIFQPQLVCIGGGVSNEDEHLLIEPVRQLVRRECYGSSKELCEVKKCMLGNDAGLVGAALLGRAIREISDGQILVNNN